jgi:predicted nucleic acid-binding protein
MRTTYLFDASAAIEIYLPRSPRTKKAVQFILDQKKTFKQATLFIPNFCIVEVINTFGRMHFSQDSPDQPLDSEDYEKNLNKFREDVHWGKTLYQYELNRYHIIAADRIIPAEHRLPRRYEHDHLSTFDILIIAMACELGYIGSLEDTFLVTCDLRLKQVFDDLKRSDVSCFMVPGLLGDVDDRRWTPPQCVYLPGVKHGELKHVSGQGPYNP